MGGGMKGEVERLRQVVSRHFGLALSGTDPAQLAAVLERRARGDTRAYLDRLESEPSSEELAALAGDVTIGETYFFRHAEQLRAFAEVALVDRLRKLPPGRRLQILSAGCSTGEEAYSLAMVAAEHGVRQVSVLGVDLNGAALARAVRGRYSAWALRETPPALRARWFRQEGDDIVIDDALRAVVRFEEGNLTTERRDRFDIVFFRNVMMYFTLEKAQTVAGHLAGALAPGGWLFLGHAETLRGVSHDFHLHHTHDTFYYQRRDGEVGDAPPPPVAWPSPAPVSTPTPTSTSEWVASIARAADRITQLAGQRPTERLPPVDLTHALALFAEERFDAALAAIPPGSSHAPALLLGAVSHVQAGRPEAAVLLGRRLLALDELDADAHHVLSMCHAAAGDRAAAIDEDQIAAYLDPGFAMARLHLGLLADQAGDRATARRELAAAQTLLAREEARRISLFGGGFGRETLLRLCRDRLGVGR
jgi:chemotaxis protein methyltransferase CheR